MSVRDRDEMVVARLQALAPHLDGEPQPDFRATTRARLVAMAAVRTPQPAPRRARTIRGLLTAGPATPSPWRSRLTAGLAAAALAVTGVAAVVAVSTDALPGDTLYALKRGTEQTQLSLAGSARGEVLLRLARTRLDEVRALGGATEPVLATLETMDAQTSEAAALLTGQAVLTTDDAPLQTLGDWADAQSTSLTEAQPDVPPEAQDEVADSLALLDAIGARTDGLMSVLDCAEGPATVGTDELGPVPGLCPAGGGARAGGGELPGGQLPGGELPGGELPGGERPGVGSDAGTDPRAVPRVPGNRPLDPSLPSVGGDESGLPGSGGSEGGLLDPLQPSPPEEDAPPADLGLPVLPGVLGTESGADVGSSGSGVLPGLAICLPPLATLGDC